MTKILNKKAWVGGLLGALAGYAYYHYIGCTTGTCPLSGNPILTPLIWGIVGYTLLSAIQPEEKDHESK